MMKRKLISTFLALTGLCIIGYSILYFLGLYKAQDSGLLIESDPVSIVYIDGIEVGNTPYESNLNPGEVTIKIKPQKFENVLLDDYETRVNLVSGIRTIIKREFKEDENYTSGAVVSFEKVGANDSFVTVVSTPDKAQVKIDEKYYGNTPLRISIPAGDHSLKIVSEGYNEKEYFIKVYKGYKLTASIKLPKTSTEQIEVPIEETIVTNK